MADAHVEGVRVERTARERESLAVGRVARQTRDANLGSLLARQERDRDGRVTQRGAATRRRQDPRSVVAGEERQEGVLHDLDVTERRDDRGLRVVRGSTLAANEDLLTQDVLRDRHEAGRNVQDVARLQRDRVALRVLLALELTPRLNKRVVGQRGVGSDRDAREGVGSRNASQVRLRVGSGEQRARGLGVNRLGREAREHLRQAGDRVPRVVDERLPGQTDLRAVLLDAEAESPLDGQAEGLVLLTLGHLRQRAGSAHDALVLDLEVREVLIERHPVDGAEVAHRGATGKLLPDRRGLSVLALEVDVGQVREREHAIRGAEALGEHHRGKAVTLVDTLDQLRNLLAGAGVRVAVEVLSHYAFT